MFTPCCTLIKASAARRWSNGRKSRLNGVARQRKSGRRTTETEERRTKESTDIKIWRFAGKKSTSAIMRAESVVVTQRKSGRRTTETEYLRTKESTDSKNLEVCREKECQYYYEHREWCCKAKKMCKKNNRDQSSGIPKKVPTANSRGLQGKSGPVLSWAVMVTFTIEMGGLQACTAKSVDELIHISGFLEASNWSPSCWYTRCEVHHQPTLICLLPSLMSPSTFHALIELLDRTLPTSSEIYFPDSLFQLADYFFDSLTYVVDMY